MFATEIHDFDGSVKLIVLLVKNNQLQVADILNKELREINDPSFGSSLISRYASIKVSSNISFSSNEVRLDKVYYDKRCKFSVLRDVKQQKLTLRVFISYEKVKCFIH